MARLERAALLLFAAGIYSFFLCFTADGLRSWFSGDDVMNLHWYWSRSPFELVRGNFLFWSDYYRPMGGVFYRSFYALAGLDSLPFRIAALAFASLNLALMYLTARTLSGSRAVGAAVVILLGPNASLCYAYYDTGMIYDVLAFFFYYLTLWLYIRTRERGTVPSWGAVAGFSALYLCAINAKEVAVTLPVLVGIYEAIVVVWGRPPGLRRVSRPAPPGALWTRLWHRRDVLAPWRFTICAAFLTAVFLAGKYAAPQSHFHSPGYQSVYSPAVYLETLAKYLQQLSYREQPLPPAALAALLIGAIGVAFLSRQKHLIWTALSLPVGVLPLAFLPPRNGFAFYVPAFGWVLYTAGLLHWLATARAPVRLRPWLAGTLVAALAAWALPLHAKFWGYVLPVIHREQYLNREANEKLRAALGPLKPGARVLLLHDPTPNPLRGWDSCFLLRLSYNDRALEVDTSRRKEKIATGPYDAVLDSVDGRFVRVAEPTLPGKPAPPR